MLKRQQQGKYVAKVQVSQWYCQRGGAWLCAVGAGGVWRGGGAQRGRGQGVEGVGREVVGAVNVL